MKPTIMTAEDLQTFLERAFEQAAQVGFAIDLCDHEVQLKLRTSDTHLRPGGTVSGPTLMMMADTASYLVVLAHVGPVALAVTTSLHMDFLRRPTPGVIVARARLLKLGKRLAVASVELAKDDSPDLIAQASVTYALPPTR